MIVLDSGAVSRLAERSQRAAALLIALRRHGLWPPTVPSPVLVECLTGRADRHANINRLLKTCDIATGVSERLARRAAVLRHRAGRGSAVDALVVAIAEPGGSVVTSDPLDLGALAGHAADVTLERV